MIREELLFQIQALADNELPEEQIPEVLKQIEGNYELREEYAQLLQLNHRLSEVPFPTPKEVWFAPFETQKKHKIPMMLGLIFGFIGLGMLVLRWILTDIVYYESGFLVNRQLHLWALIALGFSFCAFLFHALWYKLEESKGKSYKRILK